MAFSIIPALYYTTDVSRKQQDWEEGVCALKEQFPVAFLLNVAQYFFLLRDKPAINDVLLTHSEKRRSRAH